MAKRKRKVVANYTLDPDLKKQVAKQARREDLSASQWVARVLRKKLGLAPAPVTEIDEEVSDT